MTIARYVSETAVIRMVDEYENTETKMSVREGFPHWLVTHFVALVPDQPDRQPACHPAGIGSDRDRLRFLLCS